MYMNKKFICVLVGILSTLSFSLFAHGKGDVEDIHVENMNSWQEEFDLDIRKPGKYNIMITARDLGGNTHIEGPHNLWLDPNSDLPICGITNPYPNMRVVGNLNIVGTCVDDDGVSRVDLILDEGTINEKHVTAEGKEFWSYYLDTNDLEEGPHTIKVLGYDINDIPVESKPTLLTWQLDRKQPVTQVQDKSMGILVSGNVKFDGIVSDGNGIKELFYSTDNGENFFPVKINPNKTGDACTFTVNVDTRKFKDGPAVLWFKAIDKATSVGMYSFLYFIDNTKPDVQIVYPAENQVMNGQFTVAGLAKDTIGVTELSWTFGQQTGVFDLIPGNNYWAVTLDTINAKEKSQKFTIHAVDRAGNIVDVSRVIPLNQEDDKPVVTTAEPVEGQIYGNDDLLYVRGITSDDDGVKYVTIQLDNGEVIKQETKGVYYYELCGADQLTVGNHKVTVTAYDINDVPGNPVVTNIVSKGLAPDFSNPVVTAGKGTLDFVNGITIHPESGSTISVTAKSGVGLTKVQSELTWGENGIIESEIELKNVPSYTFTLPVAPESPKGVMKLTLKATDSIERVSEYKAIYYVTNTTVVKADNPVIVFDDSRVAEDGSIVSDPYYPVTGYLLGANAASVEIVPKTPFAKAVLEGNQIKIIPEMDTVGASEEIKIRVKTDKGKVVESIPLKIKNDSALPVIAIDGYSPEYAIDGREAPVAVAGKITCKTGLESAAYRLLSVKTDIAKGVIAAVKASPVTEEFTPIELDKDGAFAIEIDTAYLDPGIYVAEFVATSLAGNKNAKAFAINMIPEIEEQNGKMPVAKAPVIAWFDGMDVYGVGVYQGTLDHQMDIFARADMTEGTNALTMTVTMPDTEKAVTSKYNAVKVPSLKADIALVNGVDYASGMPVVLGYAAKAESVITINIDTGTVVNSVAYEITGEQVSGGDVTQKGTAKLIKPTVDEPLRWVAEIPVGNLPSRVNKITATIKAGNLEQVVSGSITVIREWDSETIDDAEKLYGMPAADTLYNEVDKNYVLSKGSKFFYYANLKAPVEATVSSATPGLAVTLEGNLVTLYAEKDGIYKNVTVKVKDLLGDTYTSEALDFVANTTMPDVNLVEPVFAQWVGDAFKVAGTAAHPLGIRSVEYSLDNGETWETFTIPSGKGVSNLGVTYSKDINIKDVEEGLIKIDIRATDVSGCVKYYRTSVHKDITPPEVYVVEPLEIDVVNGENLIVFDAKDNGFLAKAEYVAPPVKGKTQNRIDIPLGPLVTTHVGTTEAPIDDAMSFVFTDDAGNKTQLEAWKFSIDNESDLPVTEIHVPEEMQVITRDFTISGVVYDDDGESSIFYKIDDGEYKQVSTKEVYKEINPAAEYKLNTSFSIDVPLLTLTDNEHTVTVYSVDVNGVKGLETKRTFRISLEEPKGAVVAPTIDTSVREIITISGWASDKNDISKIQVSLDNGNSYNDAVGTTDWSYTVDTRAIPGGTQVVFLKVTDGYGIQGLYSSLINIDNNAPELNLELPLDDSTTTGQLFFSGYTFDNVEITELYLTIRNLEKGTKPEVRNFKIDRIIGQTVDIRDLPDGFYNVELTGKDKAGNVTNVSRNIHLDKNRAPATVDVLYPLNGEHKQGLFTVYGQAAAEGTISVLKLYLDGNMIQETEVTDCGFFKFDMGPETIADGVHTYRVDAVLTNGIKVSSREQTITYSSIGPWITIENFTYGDFATARPYLRGQAGYSISEDDILLSKTKEAPEELKAAVAAKKVQKVEISFDNGKTFQLLSTNEKWMYRIENQDLPEGYHFFLLRATMKNGETAISRIIIQIDNTSPSIRLIAPSIGGRYNQKLTVSGLSNDDERLEDVTVTLRKGDKSSYEVPSFIQGLYVDVKFWGASLFQVGAGLTFFDDVVKVQASYGQFTQAQRNLVSETLGISLTDMRYGGNILSMKILANISEIPFSFFLGHDYDWLYADVAVGADFSYFTETNSGKPQILSAILGQLEFPKIKLQNVKAFSSFSLYTEGSVWFIPTDVSSTVKIKNLIPQIGIGFRTNIF